jgi:hypothetical protein
MKAGRFRLTCDAITLVKGKLANGQHRMWAVVESNMPQPFILLRTDDEDLYKVIDTGASRSIADTLRLTSGNQMAAVAALVIGFQRKTITPVSYTKKTNRLDIVEFVETNAEALLEAVHLASRLTANHLNLIAKSAPAAFYYLAKPLHGQQRVEEFLNHVYSGDLPESACSVLRDRFMRERMSLKSMYPQTGLALMIKAFNVHYLGVKIARNGLRMADGDSYPEIERPLPQDVPK